MLVSNRRKYFVPVQLQVVALKKKSSIFYLQNQPQRNKVRQSACYTLIPGVDRKSFIQ